MVYRRPTAGDPGQGGNFSGQEQKDYGKHVSNLNYTGTAAHNSLLAAAAAAANPPAPSYGHGGGGGGYGGGGGGGGWAAAQAAQAAKIAKMTAMLNTQRAGARKALPGYLKSYNTGVGKIGRENAGLTKGYGKQINEIMRRLQQTANAENQRISGDVGAQGGDLAGMRAAAGENAYGAQAIGGAQNAYNLRLAQIMGSQTADYKATGQAVNQAASANLDDSYMRALMALQGMG